MSIIDMSISIFYKACKFWNKDKNDQNIVLEIFHKRLSRYFSYG